MKNLIFKLARKKVTLTGIKSEGLHLMSDEEIRQHDIKVSNICRANNDKLQKDFNLLINKK